MTIIPQEPLENTFAFFHITGTGGAMVLSLIAKRRKMDDSGTSSRTRLLHTTTAYAGR